MATNWQKRQMIRSTNNDFGVWNQREQRSTADEDADIFIEPRSKPVNWRKMLDEYWLQVINDTEEVLQLLRIDFIRNGLPLNDKFKAYFLKTTNARISVTCEQFFDSSALEDELFANATASNAGTQDQNIPTWMDDGNTSIRNTVHEEYLAQAGDGRLSNEEIKPIENIKPNPKNASISPPNNIKDHSLSKKTLSDLLTERFKTTINQSNELDMAMNQSLNQWMKSEDSTPKIRYRNQAVEGAGSQFKSPANLPPSSSKQIELNPRHLPKLGAYSTPVPKTRPSATYQTSDSQLFGPETDSFNLKEERGTILWPSEVGLGAPMKKIAKVQNDIPRGRNCDHNGSESPAGEQTNSNAQSLEVIIDLTDNEGNLQMGLQKRKRKNVAEMSGDSRKKRKLSTESKEAKQFKCEFCSYSSAYKHHLTVHTRIHTNEKPFKCEVCATGFTQKNNLKKHMRTHADQFPFQCSICRQGFSVKQEWKLHEKSCNPRRFECFLCEYTSLRKDHLVQHMRIHTGELPFKCEVCTEGTHADQFPFQCSNCRQVFSVKQKWKLHEKSCNRRRYDCYLCEYTSFQKCHLVVHMRIHTGELPFKCEVCAMGFTRKDSLKSHMRTHADQFPFQCSNCRQGFSAKQKWKLHEKSCNTKRYECYLCQYTSLLKGDLVRHMRIHTGVKPFQCSKCPERFTQKSHLHSHTKHNHKTTNWSA